MIQKKCVALLGARVARADIKCLAADIREMGYKLQSKAFITISLAMDGKMETFYRIFGVELPHALLLLAIQRRRQRRNDADQMVLIFPIYFSITRQMLWSDGGRFFLDFFSLFLAKHNELANSSSLPVREREIHTHTQYIASLWFGGGAQQESCSFVFVWCASFHCQLSEKWTHGM